MQKLNPSAMTNVSNQIRFAEIVIVRQANGNFFVHLLACSFHSRDSIGHPVWSECPHHAEPLQGVLVLPLLGKLLLLRTLTVHKLLPPLGRALVGRLGYGMGKTFYRKN